MEEKKFCPHCGHQFVQGEGNYNYDTALIDYTCPDCGWEGTEALDEDTIMDDLSEELGEGIDVTPEDAVCVLSELEYHDCYESAVKSVADNIRECLDDDDDEEDEDEDLSDKLETYNGSYNKRTLKKEGLCIVCWPESQSLCEMDNFWEHAWLINDTYGLNRFGSCAYVVEEDWYCQS